MKASELIRVLASTMTDHGDLTVLVSSDLADSSVSDIGNMVIAEFDGNTIGVPKESAIIIYPE